MSTDYVFLEVNPCFERAHVFFMDLQPAADPYSVICILSIAAQSITQLVLSPAK